MKFEGLNYIIQKFKQFKNSNTDGSSDLRFELIQTQKLKRQIFLNVWIVWINSNIQKFKQQSFGLNFRGLKSYLIQTFQKFKPSAGNSKNSNISKNSKIQKFSKITKWVWKSSKFSNVWIIHLKIIQTIQTIQIFKRKREPTQSGYQRRRVIFIIYILV